ncbi:MAG: HAD-IC family P-type ATPase, partial [Clostridiales bacterium]|nr:HAD-IC family P-type ATPase [Clostridiales bacterium]
MIYLMASMKRNREKHKKTNAAATPRPHTDPHRGLSDEEVSLRAGLGQFNTQPKRITKTIAQILFENICTFFNFLNGCIFAALVVVDSYRNILFMGVVLCNLLIGIVQECRAKFTIEKLSLLNAPLTCVIRNGKRAIIDSEGIVPDDIIALQPGQQIPTDCVLVEGAIETDESHVSGESRPQYKKAGDTLLSGSAVLSGGCLACVTRVGADCYVNRLASEAKKYVRPRSELMRSLRLIIRVTGAIVVPLGALLFIRMYGAPGGDMQSAAEQTAASMLGMIPSGLMLLTSVSLSVAVITLGKYRALAQQPQCVEMLSRVDMLCLDKTGTLTTGDLCVEHVVYMQGVKKETADTLLIDLIATMPAANPTARALHAFAAALPGVIRDTPVSGITAFSSSRRYSAAAFAGFSLYI